jgi:hypothetical protein
MTNAYVSVSSDVLDEGHYQVTLAQTGIDTASLDVRQWNTGSDISGNPDSDNSYALTMVRTHGTGLTCVTSAFMQNPSIALTLSPAGDIPSVSLAVTHTWFNNETHDYPLSASDYADLQAFIVAAAFPLG